MKKLLFISTIALISLLNAVDITSNKELYSSQEKILLTVSEMAGNKQDWVAIYPENSSTEWGNVLQWTWTKGKINHTFTFQELPEGNYKARAFFNNSYILESSHKFQVQNQNPLPITELKSQKNSYLAHENIFIENKNMAGNKKDWIAIYKVGTSNDWNNVLRWRWTKGKINDTLRFNGLPAGEYEARAFFNNSYKLEAVTRFSVKNNNQLPVKIDVSKNIFKTNERIRVVVDNMLGDQKDWVAIFSKGSSSEWKNVIRWSWTGGEKSTLIGFKPLNTGMYEVRVFFKNSYKVEVSASFQVIDNDEAKQKLLQTAKQHCLGVDNSTNNILCANDLDNVYILSKKEANNHLFFGQYHVSLNNNQVRTISEKEIPPHAQWHGIKNRTFHTKINNSSIYIIKEYIASADENGHYLFYSKNSKELLSLTWYEKDGDILTDSIKTLDDNRKLYIERTFRDAGEKYKETYDISNPNEMKLINRKIVPLNI